MHPRPFLFLIIFAGSFLLSQTLYAGTGGCTIQDSIRKVTIKVTASAKPRNVDLDSLVNRSEAAAKSLRKDKKVKYRSQSGTYNSAIKRKPAISQTEVKGNDRRPSSTLVKRQPETVETPNKITERQQHPRPLPGVTVEQHTHNDPAVKENVTAVHEVKTARTYLWIGFMLIVVGIILAILFGKTALLVSVAGVVFVIIGYSVRH